MAHDLMSLITVLDRILEEDRVLDDQKKALVESLLEKVTSLKDLLEKSAMQHRLRDNKEMIQELQSEIRDAACEAEDIIESHAVDQMLLAATIFVSSPPFVKKGLLTSLLEKVNSLKKMMQCRLRGKNSTSLSEVMDKFDAANDKLTEIIKEDYHQSSVHDEGDAISNPSLSVAADKTNTGVMVGFDDDVLQLKYRLTSQTSAREIIPIVGMGGIGKTTLARNLYNDPLIVSHFDVRAWATVSQEYSVQAILSSLLGNISDNMSSQDLGGNLYQRLCGRRYLVVLDDIWSENAWDEIQRYFPKEGNRSRILITSRELHVAKHPDPACEEHQMHLLSDAHGWDLLGRKVFGNEEHCCPHSLEEIGQKIVSSCGGLPLAISVIGGLLSVDKNSKDLWDQVARDVRSIADNHISEILCLSYDNLPLHLKPYFLYMSAFPEDFEVRRSKLVKLLVAEGFISRKNNKSLEDVAEEFLKALVDRNLLSITSTKYDGRAESYRMHDLLRDLCVRKAEEEKFLRIFKNGNIENFRRVSLHEFTEDVADLVEELPCSRSLLYICSSYSFLNIPPILSSLRLVRVLDIYNIHLIYFPKEILNLVNLHFLAVHFLGSVPPEIWRLRNLQSLLVKITGRDDDILLPYEAWEISSLRHIIFKSSRKGTIYIDFKIPCVHKNLQTISRVHLHDLLASNLLSSIPNIRKMIIDGGEFVSEDRIIDLSQLHKLETLKLFDFSVGVLSLVKSPNCLKKLSFYGCNLPMGFVNGIGDLQYLQVLEIKGCVFRTAEHIEEEEEEEEWEINEGVEFCSLQFLSLQNLHIVRWKADYSNFPRLRHLKIRLCEELEEIPACFGEISTLEMIEVDMRSPSHVDWANEVRETQRDEYGNESLQIRICDKY